MPIYEYECFKCANRITKLRKISERHDYFLCANCGGNTSLLVSKFTTLSVDTIINRSDYEISTQESVNSNIERSRGSCGVNIGNANIGNLQIHNNEFSNMDVGISVPRRLNADMQGNTFSNVKTPYEIRNK